MSLSVLLKVLGGLAMPPASMAAGLVLAGGAWLLKRRRVSAILAAVAVGETLLLSLPPVADLLLQPLEAEALRSSRDAKPCCYDFIVVLAGGVAPASPVERFAPHLTDSADRLWVAAQLFHRGVAPLIVVSGGAFLPDADTPSELQANAFRKFLRDLGVPNDAIVSEGKSKNTLENIGFVREIVGNKPVALVTSAYHMPRALRLARRDGLDVAAFPADWRTPPEGPIPWSGWMPSVEAMTNSKLALWEYLALAFDLRRPEAPAAAAK